MRRGGSKLSTRVASRHAIRVPEGRHPGLVSPTGRPAGTGRPSLSPDLEQPQVVVIGRPGRPQAAGRGSRVRSTGESYGDLLGAAGVVGDVGGSVGATESSRAAGHREGDLGRLAGRPGRSVRHGLQGQQSFR